MSNTATLPPGPDSAVDTFDPATLNSEQLGEIMRAADALRTAPEKPAAKPEPKPAAVEPAAEKPEAAEKPAVEPAVEKPAVEKPAEEKPVEKPVEKPAAEKPEVEREDAPDRFRPRLTDEEDIAIALIAKRQGITIRQATRVYEKGLESVQPEKKPEADPIAEIDTQMAEGNKALEQIRKDLAQAQTDMESEKVVELTEKMTDQKLALRSLEARKRGTIEDRQTRADDVADDMARDDYAKVLERYPDLKPPPNGQPVTEKRQRFLNFVSQRQREGDLFVQDPRTGELVPVTPRWRSILAREFEDEDNLSPAGRTAPAKPETAAPVVKTDSSPPAQQPRRAPAATVLTTGDAPVSGSTFEATPEEVSKAIDKMTSEQLAELMKLAGKLQKEN